MGCTCLFCASLKDILFPFPIHYYYHDQWLAIMAYHNGGIYLCDHKLVRYRQHADNVDLRFVEGAKERVKNWGSAILSARRKTYISCCIDVSRLNILRKIGGV